MSVLRVWRLELGVWKLRSWIDFGGVGSLSPPPWYVLVSSEELKLLGASRKVVGDLLLCKNTTQHRESDDL